MAFEDVDDGLLKLLMLELENRAEFRENRGNAGFHRVISQDVLKAYRSQHFVRKTFGLEKIFSVVQVIINFQDATLDLHPLTINFQNFENIFHFVNVEQAASISISFQKQHGNLGLKRIHLGNAIIEINTFMNKKLQSFPYNILFVL